MEVLEQLVWFRPQGMPQISQRPDPFFEVGLVPGRTANSLTVPH